MKVIAFVPLPPPYAGPEIATQRMLDVLSLPPDCELRVVKSNVRSSNDKKGRFDKEGIINASKSLFNLFLVCLYFRPQKVYLLINPSKAGFLRDAAAICISKLFFCKVVGHYHGSHFNYFYKTSSCWYRFLIRTCLSRLYLMLVQAERLKNIFSELLPQSKMSILYNGVSNDCLDRGKAAIDLRRGKKMDFVTFLFLGHLSFTKGFYDLVSACKKLLEEGKKFRFLVAGDFILNHKTQTEFLEEPYRQFYRDHYFKIHSEILDFIYNQRSNSVEYHGVVDGEKKNLLFEQADALVLPSYTEGFPNVVLEAMSFGLALVVTPVGALPEILKEPDNVLFVKRGNTEVLLKQMERLIEFPSLCLQMGENNRGLVTQKYHVKFTSRQFGKLIFNQKRELH